MRIAAGPRDLASAAVSGRGIALATLAGAVIRLALIARQPIGYDEDFTSVAVHQTPARMLDIVAHDSAPPLFYLGERMVVGLFDVLGLAALGGPGGPVALRLLPVLAGIALIPLLAALAGRIAGGRAAVWTAVFVALCPATVLLSGFARMYGPAAGLTVAATLLLWRALDGSTEQPSGDSPTPERLWPWVAYTSCAAAAVWTDYFCILALAGIALGAVWLRPDRRTALRVVAATAVAIGSVAPWLVVARDQLAHSSQGFWVGTLSPAVLGGTLGQMMAGPQVPPAVSFAALLVALQAATIAVWVLALGRLAFAWNHIGERPRRGVVFCLIAASGIAALVVVSVWRPILDARYANLMWMPVFALAGAGLALLPRQLATGAIVVVAVAGVALNVPVTHTEVRELIPQLEAQAGPQDLVATTTDQYLILLDESGPNVRERLHLLGPDDPPWFAGTAAYPAGAVLHSVPADVIANGGRIYWVAAPGVTTSLVPAGYRQTQSRCVLLACLTVYAPAG